MGICFERSMALLRGTSALSLCPALIQHHSGSAAPHLSLVCFALSWVSPACRCLFMTGSPHTSPLPDPIPKPMTPPPSSFHQTNCWLSFPVICFCCLPAGPETDLRLSGAHLLLLLLLLRSGGGLVRGGGGSFTASQETSAKNLTELLGSRVHVPSDL